MRRLLSRVAFSTLLITSSCISNGGNQLVIAVFAPSRGPDAAIGLQARRGAELAAADLNRRGGVRGSEVKIVFTDDSDASKTVSLMNELVRKHRPSAVIGPESLDPIRSKRNPFTSANVPVLSLAPDGTLPLDSSVFRLSPSNKDMASVLVDWLVKTRSIKKICVVTSSDAFGRDGSRWVTAALKKAGTTPTTVQRITPGALDLSSVAQGLRSSGADAVVYWTGAADGARLTRAIRDLGWGAQIAGPSTLFDSEYRSLAGELSENTVLALQRISEEKWFGQELRDWFIGYHKRYTLLPIAKQDTLVSDIPLTAITSYDAVDLVADAVVRAGSTNPSKVGVELRRTTNFQGVLKDYSFRKTRESFIAPQLSVARFYNLALLYDVEPGSDRDRQIAFYKIQVSAFYVPDEYLNSEQGQKLKDKVLEDVLSDPENVEFFRAYTPPRPPPGPV